MRQAKVKKATWGQEGNKFACQACGHKKCLKLFDMPSTEFNGTLPDGRRYTRVDRARVKCKSCGFQSIWITHQLEEPADETAKE